MEQEPFMEDSAQNRRELKFRILYAASRLNLPAPFETLQEIIMSDERIGFFDFSAALHDLTDSGHLSLSEDGQYTITEEGLRDSLTCEKEIPYSVRLSADKSIEIFRRWLSRESQVKAEILPFPDGSYLVKLSFRQETGEPLLNLEIMCPTEKLADDLANRFTKEPERLYSQILNVLYSGDSPGA